MMKVSEKEFHYKPMVEFFFIMVYLIHYQLSSTPLNRASHIYPVDRT